MNRWKQARGMGRPLRIGHRGAARLAPQNTLRGFARAIALGVDAVELDVRWTKDRQLVVLHDEDVSHSTNGKGLVRDLTLAEVRRLDAGEGERVPTLEEALVFLKGKALVVVDLKLIGYEEQVVLALRSTGMAESALVCTLLPDSLRRVKVLAPDVFTAISYPEDKRGLGDKPGLAWLVNLFLMGMRETLPLRITPMMRQAGADGAMIYHRLVTPALARAVHRAGGFLGAWTADAPGVIASLRAAGVDSITSNRPDLL